jgi:hypothetical protein
MEGALQSGAAAARDIVVLSARPCNILRTDRTVTA